MRGAVRRSVRALVASSIVGGLSACAADTQTNPAPSVPVVSAPPPTAKNGTPDRTDRFDQVLRQVQQVPEVKKRSPSIQVQQLQSPTSQQQQPGAATAQSGMVEDLSPPYSTEEKKTLANAIARTIAPCMTFASAPKNPDNWAVALRVAMNPDRTVESADVTDDGGRYQGDPEFRAMAQSMQRAFVHPGCRRLPLPVDRPYSEWANFRIRIDARDFIR